MDLSRRDFLKAAGGAAGGLVFLPSLLDGGMKAFAATPVTNTAEKEDGILYGTCGICSMGCAYIAHMKDGRIMNLTGNPKDQVAEGKLCVKGYSSIRMLYDPDRLKYPMKRTNPKKGIGVDPGWVKITWDEAIDTTADKLKGVYDTYGPQAIMMLGRPKPWTKHFAQSIGTPNHIVHINTCYSTQEVMWRAVVTGSGKTWTVNYEDAKYILGFGWDAMGKSKNHWGRSVNTARMNGARMVILDPRLSITASKADEWIPVKPGTDLAFALAMIRTIINEDLYDSEFVGNYTYGFEELKAAVQEYTPEWASSICEVPADTIVKVAREFATIKPAVIAHHKRDAGGPNYANSWRLNHCYVILDALVGSLDRPGGHILDRTPKLSNFVQTFNLPDYPDSRKGPRVDSLEQFPLLYQRTKGSFSNLADAILREEPYPIKAAVVWKDNVLAFPDPRHIEEAIMSLDFVAVSDIYPSEIVQLADIVLPETTFFSSNSLNPRTYHAMYPQVALRQALPGLYDCKSFGSVSISLLKKMGFNEYAPEGIGGGVILKADLEALGITAEDIINNGGVWGDEVPLKPKTEFGTPSKKIELYGTVLEKYGYDPLPKWEPPLAKTSTEYPFHLLIFRKPWHRMTQSQNDPVTSEFWPENKALINSEVAREMGIADGEEICVESTAGKINLKAQPTKGIRPDCIAIEHGFGHWSQELGIACGKGANDGELIPDRSIEDLLKINGPDMAALMEDVVLKVTKA
ncbi:molybdopterin-dependent oxidoreductase [Chloroflexota bacterium]